MPVDWQHVVFYFHPIFLRHLEGVSHPESPDRLQSVVDYLIIEGIYQKLDVREPSAVDLKWVEKIHSPEYVKQVKNACTRSPVFLDDGDTIVTEKSYQSALYAAGAVTQAIDVLMSEPQASSAFCAVRPPGHHAEQSTAMGFCLFNNIAIGAQYAIEKYGLERIFILDWDVHHGNGTQHVFEERKDVFYCSLHQWPFYPGSGREDERGLGAGAGYTHNIPLPAGTGHHIYLKHLTETVLPAIADYLPDLILVSCGFDAHQDDPLANLNLTRETFSELTREIVSAAKPTSTGGIVSVLEGGYNLRVLPLLVKTHLQQLALG